MSTPTRWQRVLIGTQERAYLETATVHHHGRKVIKVWSQTPFFVCKQRGGAANYTLNATGMDCSGAAATLSHHWLISEAKAAGIKLAAVDATPVEFWFDGNVRFVVGTQVTFKALPAFPGTRRLGTIVGINSGGIAEVRWVGQAETAPQLLSLLYPHAFTDITTPSPAKDAP